MTAEAAGTEMGTAERALLELLALVDGRIEVTKLEPIAALLQRAHRWHNNEIYFGQANDVSVRSEQLRNALAVANYRGWVRLTDGNIEWTERGRELIATQSIPEAEKREVKRLVGLSLLTLRKRARALVAT